MESVAKLSTESVGSRRELVRPPVYGSNGRSYKMLVMFLFFQRVISERYRLTKPCKRTPQLGRPPPKKKLS